MLTNAGKKVVCNNVGANMLPGIACSFIKDAKLSGKLNADYAVLECDEASLRHIANHIKIDKVLVTNLFRDQLDRYGDIELTAALLDEAFKESNVNKRAELLHQAEALLINEEAAVIPVVFNTNAYVVSKELSNVKTDYWGVQIFTKTQLKNYVQYLPSVKAAASNDETEE